MTETQGYEVINLMMFSSHPQKIRDLRAHARRLTLDEFCRAHVMADEFFANFWYNTWGLSGERTPKEAAAAFWQDTHKRKMIYSYD